MVLLPLSDTVKDLVIHLSIIIDLHMLPLQVYCAGVRREESLGRALRQEGL